MRACAMLVALMVPALAAAEDKKVVKEIPTKDLKLKVPEGAKAGVPAVVTSAEELTKCPVCGGEADAIKKQVDFSKEKLLVFAWSGSGQDKVNVTGETKDGKTTVTTTYTPGKTRDLRQHVKLFVVPKDALVK